MHSWQFQFTGNYIIYITLKSKKFISDSITVRYLKENVEIARRKFNEKSVDISDSVILWNEVYICVFKDIFVFYLNSYSCDLLKG